MEIERLSIYTAQITGHGAESGLVRLAKGFNNRGLDVDFVFANAQGELDIPIPDDIRMLDLGASDKYPVTISAIPKLVKYLKSEQPPVMISCPGAVNVSPLLARRLTNVDTRIIAKGGKKPPKDCLIDREYRRSLMSALMRITYPMADKKVIGTKSAAGRLLSTTPIKRDDLYVIPPPVVTPRMLSKANEAVSHQWFNSIDVPVILAAQNLKEPKDPETLIKSFSIVKREMDARLMILGEGEKRPKIESLISEYDLDEHVSMPGFVPNPYKYMKNSDLFVLSSKKELVGSALVEAMACGCPVVATDCPPGGVAEFLENGKWGKLVPVGDPESMATAMLEALDNPIQDVETRANDHSLEESVEAHLDLISQL